MQATRRGASPMTAERRAQVEARAKLLKQRWDAEKEQENADANNSEDQQNRPGRRILSLGSTSKVNTATLEQALGEARAARHEQAVREGVVERNLELEAQLAVEKGKRARADEELQTALKELAQEKLSAGKARVRVTELENELAKMRAALEEEREAHAATKSLLTKQQLSGLELREQVANEKTRTEAEKAKAAILEKETENLEKLERERRSKLEEQLATVQAAHASIEAANKSLIEEGGVGKAVQEAAEKQLQALRDQIEQSMKANNELEGATVEQLQDQANTFQDLCDSLSKALDDNKSQQRGAERAVGALVERLSEAQQVAQFQMMALHQQVATLTRQQNQQQQMLALPPPQSSPVMLALPPSSPQTTTIYPVQQSQPVITMGGPQPPSTAPPFINLTPPQSIHVKPAPGSPGGSVRLGGRQFSCGSISSATAAAPMQGKVSSDSNRNTPGVPVFFGEARQTSPGFVQVLQTRSSTSPVGVPLHARQSSKSSTASTSVPLQVRQSSKSSFGTSPNGSFVAQGASKGPMFITTSRSAGNIRATSPAVATMQGPSVGATPVRLSSMPEGPPGKPMETFGANASMPSPGVVPVSFSPRRRSK